MKISDIYHDGYRTFRLRGIDTFYEAVRKESPVDLLEDLLDGGSR
jgi:hypothetical protein